MPFPLSSRARSGLRRRSLLAGAAGAGAAAGAVLLVGCSDSDDSGSRERASSAAEQRARARAAHDSTALLARYDAALAAHPGLAGRLRPLRAEVERHVEAFDGTTHRSASASPSAARVDAAGAEGASARAAAEVPADPAAARTALAGAERALADRRTSALLDVPGELARLLASVAAAGAAHAYLLAEGAGEGHQ